MPNAERPGQPGQPDQARERRDEFLRARIPQDATVKPTGAPTDQPDEKGPDEATPPTADESLRDDT